MVDIIKLRLIEEDFFEAELAYYFLNHEFLFDRQWAAFKSEVHFGRFYMGEDDLYATVGETFPIYMQRFNPDNYDYENSWESAVTNITNSWDL